MYNDVDIDGGRPQVNLEGGDGFTTVRGRGVDTDTVNLTLVYQEPGELGVHTREVHGQRV